MLKQTTIKKVSSILKELKLISINNLEDSAISVFSSIVVKDSSDITYNTILSNLLQGKIPSIQSAVNKSLAFSILSIKIHGNKYKYNRVNYINSTIPVEIECPKHGVFKQTPNNHLRGKGCETCARQNTTEYFIEKAINVHKSKYDYSLVRYINNSTRIKIICKEHGIFLQNPANHLNGSNCPICVKDKGTAYSKTKWLNNCKRIQNNTPILYIIKCFNNKEEFVKIGITASSIKKRFKNKHKFPYDYKVITQIKSNPSRIWDLEKHLHKIYKSFHYLPKLSFGGKTECFTINIIN